MTRFSGKSRSASVVPAIRIRDRFATVVLAVSAGIVASSIVVGCGGYRAGANTETVDFDGPRHPWGKAIGDIDGDGLPDIVIGGQSRSQLGIFDRILRRLGVDVSRPDGGDLVWYRNPGWEKIVVSRDYRIRTDIAIGDMNGDGLNDIVALTNGGVLIFIQPGWIPRIIDVDDARDRFHDVELADLDLDGRLDIVLRNQTRFGYNNGDRVVLLRRDETGSWGAESISVPHGEGLKVRDIDQDRFPDIVVNDVWLRNPGSDGQGWVETGYAERWGWPDVSIDVADINDDGLLDIVLAPSEPAGEVHRISWFEAPADARQAWTEHVIEEGVEAVHHSAATGDFDGDGDVDIFTAEMNQGADPDEVKVYVNHETGRSFERRVLATSGSHNLQAADLDMDGRAEAVGTNWQIEGYSGRYPVIVYRQPGRNRFHWRQHDIGNNAPWQNLFVFAADLDSDGWDDLVSGRAWFRNPGSLDDEWTRREIDAEVGTWLIAGDFDDDGDVDLFGSEWDGLTRKPTLRLRARAKIRGTDYPGSGDGGNFVWAENDGSAGFRIHKNVDYVEGDFLQGIAHAATHSDHAIYLSWHESGAGLHRIAIPGRPRLERWVSEKISSFSQDEQLSIEDINSDGHLDVITGTAWLDAADAWDVVRFGPESGKPDRHAVVDVDRDGTLDVVVGYEAISRPGNLAWYSDIASLPDASSERLIDRPVGPMSLAAVDIDDDGDIDLLVGEHNLESPESARLLMYLNIDGNGRRWKSSVLFVGFEHHDGVLPYDFDCDGDLDVASIGWQHSTIAIFENPGSPAE